LNPHENEAAGAPLHEPLGQCLGQRGDGSDAALTIVSAAPANPAVELAKLSIAKRLQSLWRREGAAVWLSDDCRRDLIAEASAQHIAKRSKQNV